MWYNYHSHRAAALLDPSSCAHNIVQVHVIEQERHRNPPDNYDWHTGRSGHSTESTSPRLVHFLCHELYYIACTKFTVWSYRLIDTHTHTPARLRWGFTNVHPISINLIMKEGSKGCQSPQRKVLRYNWSRRGRYCGKIIFHKGITPSSAHHTVQVE